MAIVCNRTYYELSINLHNDSVLHSSLFGSTLCPMHQCLRAKPFVGSYYSYWYFNTAAMWSIVHPSNFIRYSYNISSKHILSQQISECYIFLRCTNCLYLPRMYSVDALQLYPEPIVLWPKADYQSQVIHGKFDVLLRSSLTVIYQQEIRLFF